MSDANLYVSLSDGEYESYAESVYKYLSDNDYYYVGTYKQQGLIAEMIPRYVYEPIDDSYDFSALNHKFTYSAADDLSSMSDGYYKINACFVITIERVEDTKYSAFASETYNTIIRLRGNNSIFANVKLCESIKWGGYITDETLDYVDIQKRCIGVNEFSTVSNKVDVKVSNKVDVKVSNKLNKIQLKIIVSMRDNPNVTIRQLIVITGLSEPGIKKNLKQLKELGIIERVGANKNGYWEVIK